MKKKIAILFLLAGLCAGFWKFQTDTLELQNVRIIRVTDGDTYLCKAGGRIFRLRLSSIDCPELAQDGGKEAKAFAVSQLGDKPVRLKLRKKEDKYGRKLGDIFYGEPPRSLSVSLAVNGHAWVWESPETEEEIRKSVRSAQERRAGLWAKPNPISPYRFRQSNKH